MGAAIRVVVAGRRTTKWGAIHAWSLAASSPELRLFEDHSAQLEQKLEQLHELPLKAEGLLHDLRFCVESRHEFRFQINQDAAPAMRMQWPPESLHL
jgi:hypothetical protein